MDVDLKIAMVGNPNCGKTTVYNALTSERHKVGNYAGVTVELVEGIIETANGKICLVDLPGTYSLTAYSDDERVTRNYILDESPDVILNIVDASNLERNLYLTTQLLELEVPVVIALNKMDIAKKRGVEIDIQKLSKLVGVEIVPIIGCDGTGVDEMLLKVEEVAEAGCIPERYPDYGPEVGPHVDQIESLIASATEKKVRWYAVKLLEGDEDSNARVKVLVGDKAENIITEADKVREHLEAVCGDSAEIILADRRYGFISGACTEASVHTVEMRHDTSDQIDKIVTHPMLGLPLFALMMYLLFQLTFWIGNPISDLIGSGIDDYLIPFLDDAWTGDGVLKNLVINGALRGVGGVLTFVPLIVLIFLGVSVLEDSGYMARAAFVMDKLMHKIGLHGHSFVPMIIGFGCTVPAILATRALKSRRDRLMTILILPLMSCSARIPIYVLVTGAFFEKHLHAPMMWAMYVIGVLLAVIVAKVLSMTTFKGQASIFVMELPPYRQPTMKGLVVHIWDRIWMYLKKAGTVILAASLIMWVLSNYPVKTDLERDYSAERETIRQQIAALSDDERVSEKIVLNDTIKEITDAEKSEILEYTVSGRIGKGLEPMLKPMGFDWKIGTALIGAAAAKELFVSQLAVVYATGESEYEGDGPPPKLQDKLRENYTPLVGFCIMLFCLISLPCIGTMAATVQEAGGLKWGFIQAGLLTALAWVVTTIVYQIGSLC